ncbi:DUF2383 domain-containing protein [Rhodobaculum claviforme]|nr:DUF2383 domain-containing protein [Rhodobaculum claviforme]
MRAIPMSEAGARDPTGGPLPCGDEDHERLRDLHTRLVDTLAGYEKVVEKAGAEFVEIAHEFRSLHLAQSERVLAMLVGPGGHPGTDGSMLGTVNRAAVEVRAWFDGIGHNVIGALVDGEKRLLEEFKAAKAASPSVERRGVFDEMCGEIITLLQRHAPAQR